MPVILATQEAEIRRITVRSQPGQVVHETLARKTLHKNRAGRVAQGEGPEFKLQYRKKKRKEKKRKKIKRKVKGSKTNKQKLKHRQQQQK
jgi:hypothetical protein